MRARGWIVILCIVVGAGLLASVAPAAKQSGSGVHFVGTPTCTVSGDTVTCSGSIAGLGTEPASVRLLVPFGCANRGSKQHQPAGLARGQTEPIQPEGGRIDFTVSASGSCPDQMTPTFGDTATVQVLRDSRVVFTGTIPVQQ